LEGGKIRASYETELNNLKNAQRNAAVANLENTRNQALSNLQAEQQRNAATYNQQRSTANAQNRMSARNFQEYLASTGRANSGLNAQARMQNANNLNTSLNTLNAGESAALADINRRTTDAHNAYNTGLASANAQIEADYIKNLLDQRNQELARDLQERQFQESVRQFNENLALQKQQLQQRFSSGSGGGGRSSGGRRKYGGVSSNEDLEFTDSTGNAQANANAVAQAAAQQSANGMKGFNSLLPAVGQIQAKNGNANVKLYKKNGKYYYKTSSGKEVQYSK
jgi:hypothetical protein